MKVKKIFICALVLCMSFAGCSSTPTVDSLDQADVVITESTYVTYINDIYTNIDSYMGKTIQIEGMYTYEEYEGNTYRYVYRVGPGCCGNDGSMCGIEFTTENGEYPEFDASQAEVYDDYPWICVQGTLDTYTEGGLEYLTLTDATCIVMDDSQRGSDTVTL